MPETEARAPGRPAGLFDGLLDGSFRRGAAVAELIRPQSSRISGGIFVVAAMRLEVAATAIAGGVLLIVAAYGLAAVLNDLADVETDRINGRSRPLVTGALTALDAKAVALGCTISIVVSQRLLAQPAGAIVAATAVAVASFYSAGPAIQRRGIVAQAMLAFGYLVLPFLLAVSQASADRPSATVATAATLAISGTGIFLYKDLGDEAGDRATGKDTPLVRWGRTRTELAAISLVGTALVVGTVGVGIGWWTLPLSSTIALQMGHRQRGLGLNLLRTSWYVSCLLLVA